MLTKKAEDLVMQILQKAEENNTVIDSEEKPSINFEIKDSEIDVIGTIIQGESQSFVAEIKSLEENSQIQIDSEIKVQENDVSTVSEIKVSEKSLQIESEIKIQENSSIDSLREASEEICGVPKQ